MDGNCQFVAVLSQIKFVNDRSRIKFNHMYLRRMLVSHFISCKDLLYDTVKQGILENYGWDNSEIGPFSIKGYLKYMMQNKSWGDSITLCLIASMWGVRITVLDSKNLNEVRTKHERQLNEDIDFLLLFNGVEEKGHYSCIRRSDRVPNEAKGLKRTSGFDVDKDCAERVMCNDPEWDQIMETGDWTIVKKEKLATYKSKGKLVEGGNKTKSTYTSKTGRT